MWLVPTTRRSVAPSIQSIFDEFAKSFDAPFHFENSKGFSPSLDIQEDEKAVRVALEIPGIDKGDLDISLKDNILTIKGEKKQENKETKEGERTWVERSYGSFQRSIRLGENVNADDVNANLENGVLTITVPKAEEQAKKQITIN